MISGLFAIVGVALGSVLTYVVQSRMARRAEDFALSERLRRERMDAFTAFAAEAMEARSAQINRWYQRRDAGRGSSRYEEAKSQSYRSRTAARRARYLVELVAGHEDMVLLSAEAVESLRLIHKAPTKPEMEALADQTRELVERFVRDAALRVASNRTPLD